MYTLLLPTSLVMEQVAALVTQLVKCSQADFASGTHLTHTRARASFFSLEICWVGVCVCVCVSVGVVNLS